MNSPISLVKSLIAGKFIIESGKTQHESQFSEALCSLDELLEPLLQEVHKIIISGRTVKYFITFFRKLVNFKKTTNLF